MLTRSIEKGIPLTFLYPEFATHSFESHEAYVDHLLARQQEIYDLVRRNTHQAQSRQKLKFDHAFQARAYPPGDLVWVFCRYVPQKGSPKLMRAWLGPHKFVQVFQDGRVYVLDNGEMVQFERLKPHQSGPLELDTAQADSGDIVVLMDLSLSVPSMLSTMTCLSPLKKLSNYFQRHPMCLCLRVDDTGWILACAQDFGQEVHVCTNNNSIILPLMLMTR